jgi:hypothetical protein
MKPINFTSARSYAGTSIFAALSMLVVGCAKVSVTPGSIRPPEPSASLHAIEAEPILPEEIAVRDFAFSPTAVGENRSPLHRTADLFRRSSADDRRIEIGRDAAVVLSEQTAKRLNKLGLAAARIPADTDMSLSGNFLLVTGRLVKVDEGNRFTRVAFGLGAGESRMDARVHVYRVVNGERAEVLAFTTHADSGKMPGLLASMGVGEFVMGPVTLIDAIEDAASGGQKIYSSQIDYLASQTSDQVARYLSQYAATEGWIPRSKAGKVHLAG